MLPDPETISRVIDAALSEDIRSGDITCEAVIPEDATLSLVMRARQPLIAAGVEIGLAAFSRLSPAARFEGQAADGARAGTGDVLARITGPARALLTAERTALNLIQHLSGIATLSRRYADAIEGTGAALLDTRKTTPGLRELEKYAARVGGAKNHRMGLYDAVLIKDNHIALAGGVAQAVSRAQVAGYSAIEVECDTLEQAAEALKAGAVHLLLDNMEPGTLRQAVALAAEADSGRVVLEASGGVTLESIRGIAETGVDFISVGRITQSAPAVDIGLDMVE
jgi:nicotinate-nucleotide pyrophosphorylase (carboxylating)